MPDLILVESAPKSGDYLQVSVEPSRCPCPGFEEHGRCEHMALAIDVLRYGCKRSKYLFKSALHKELRRGDHAAACHWAGWVDRGYGRPVALEYLRKVWSEETLNLDLAVALHAPTLTLPEAIDLFCRSRKVWEFPEVWDHLEAVWRQPPARTVPDGPRDAQGRSTDFRVLAAALATASGVPQRLARFRMELMDAIVGRGQLTQGERRVFETRFASGRDESEDVVLLMIAAGRLPIAAADYDGIAHAGQDGGDECSRLRQPPDYAYDYHTIVGQKRIDRWKASNPGQELRVGVDTGDVDLRWAGGLLPLFWRFEAFRQTGSTSAMDRLRWSDLVRSDRWTRFCSWNTDWP